MGFGHLNVTQRRCVKVPLYMSSLLAVSFTQGAEKNIWVVRR